MLDLERQYFDQNREELLRQYPGKFIVIKEKQVLAPYNTINEALSAGAHEFGMASFLVRRTDETASEISIPALTLGILRADSTHSTGRTGAGA